MKLIFIGFYFEYMDIFAVSLCAELYAGERKQNSMHVADNWRQFTDDRKKLTHTHEAV